MRRPLKSRLLAPIVPICLAAAFSAATAAPLGAQDGEDLDRLEIAPTLGAAFNIGEVADDLVLDDGTRVSTSIEDGFGGGLRLGFRLTKHFTLEAASLSVPTEVSASAGGLSVGFDTTITTFDGSLAYNFRREGRRGWPYVVAGAGVKSYTGDFRTETDPTWSVGGGVRLRVLGSRDLRLEVRDYMSSFDAVAEGEDSEFQNDILVTLGLTFSFF